MKRSLLIFHMFHSVWAWWNYHAFLFSNSLDRDIETNFDYPLLKDHISKKIQKDQFFNYTSIAWPFCHRYKTGHELYNIENLTVTFDYDHSINVKEIEDRYGSEFDGKSQGPAAYF